MKEVPARVVLVTGGGSGIGRAVAAAFTTENCQVVIIGRTDAPLRQTAEDLGCGVTWQLADVSESHQVTTAVAAVLRQFGRIDVLVNNAGFVSGVTTDLPMADAEQLWDDVLGTNLKGAFLMAMAVAPHLPRTGGRIINISSIAAFTGGSRAGSMAYAAAKAGVHGLTFGLARELSPQGITVNAVAPGFIANTGFTGDWPADRVQALSAQTAVGRPGCADDVAGAVTFLASPRADFITGEILNVNGGWLFGR
ncbi:MAG: family oxidoreductase [Firmicutes bacterium]|nr:family oxidoreductase [Bacillota bacterium]